jgi:4-amino-4-deoxy-L-arabinose transferase-like glycosyltransferase
MALIDAGERKRWGVFGLVLLVALAARIVVVLPALDKPPNDPDGYLLLARSLVDGHGFRLVGRLTAYRPPLYPILLAPLVAVFGEASASPFLWLNVALGVATTGCVMIAARRWGHSPPRVLAAGLIVACDPVLVVQGRSVMTETFAAFLMTGALTALLRGPGMLPAALGGIWLGLASLCRPSLLASAVLVGCASLVCAPGSLRLRVLRSLSLIGATFLILTPWAARNAWVFGEPVWTTTHGGYTLALANNPVYYREVVGRGGGEVWSGPGQKRWAEGVLARTRGLPEPEANRRLAAEGWRMARVAPSTFARACVERLKRFWGVAPSGKVYGSALRLGTMIWTVPLFLALGAGLAERTAWTWPKAAAAGCLLALTIVHTLYWTDLRMRAPVVPMIALAAAGARRPRAGSGGKAATRGRRK